MMDFSRFFRTNDQFSMEEGGQEKHFSLIRYITTLLIFTSTVDFCKVFLFKKGSDHLNDPVFQLGT